MEISGEKSLHLKGQVGEPFGISPFWNDRVGLKVWRENGTLVHEDQDTLNIGGRFNFTFGPKVTATPGKYIAQVDKGRQFPFPGKDFSPEISIVVLGVIQPPPTGKDLIYIAEVSASGQILRTLDVTREPFERIRLRIFRAPLPFPEAKRVEVRIGPANPQALAGVTDFNGNFDFLWVPINIGTDSISGIAGGLPFGPVSFSIGTLPFAPLPPEVPEEEEEVPTPAGLGDVGPALAIAGAVSIGLLLLTRKR